MNKYSQLVAFDAVNAKRTFDEFYEYHSAIDGNYMCFNSTIVLSDQHLVAAVSLDKHNYHVQFFDVRDYELSNVIFTDNDPYGNVQFFSNVLFPTDDCLLLFPSIDDIQDSDLEKFGLSRENIFVLYNLHNELLKILKKDETIQKVVL
jgi:hypothetical protein